MLNLAFLAVQLLDWSNGAALIAFLMSGYACALCLRRWKSRSILTGYIAVLVVAFVYLKQYAFLELVVPEHLRVHHLQLVGLSYILFRQIHFLVDFADGQIEDLSLYAFLSYQTSLFTLQAGPIQRYQEFRKEWLQNTVVLAAKEDILLSYLRVLVGFCKVVLADACLTGRHQALETLLGFGEFQANLGNCWRLVVLFYAFPVYVFLNFSGYCDMTIGGGALLGIRLPENFNHPYLARNMIEFWERWHITLSTWIRDYLFTPMYMFLAKWRPSSAWAWATLSYFVAFLLAGMWHGATYGFAAFGLLHGLGVATAKLWESAIIKRWGRRGLREYLRSRPVRILAGLVTFHFACATFLVFPGGTDLIRVVTPSTKARAGVKPPAEN